MDIENRLLDLQNKIDAIKEELRDVQTNYLKKDELGYQKYLQKVDIMEDIVSVLKTNVESISKQTAQNTEIMQTLNVTNTKLTTLLSEYSKTQNEIKSDIKDLKTTVNNINIDSSKNTDVRGFVLDIIKKILVAIGCIIVGMALSQANMNNSKNNQSKKEVGMYIQHMQPNNIIISNRRNEKNGTCIKELC